MPTLPLLSAAAGPGQSHHVRSPGGYEGWNFHATGDDGRLHVSASIHESWDGDVKCLRRYWLYRRFPTRFAPPDPRGYPAVTFALFERGHRPVRFVTRSAREDVRVREDGSGVRVAGSHFERLADGSIRLHLRGVADRRTLAANFTFRPLITDHREIRLTEAGEHRVLISSPLCEVEGQVSLFAETGGAPQAIGFAGIGSHDQTFGTRLPAEAADMWWTGRALLDGCAFTFFQIGEAEATLVSARRNASIESMRVPVESRGHELRVGPLHLSRPAELDGGSFETVTAFDAVVAGEQGRALCRRVRFGRMSNPLWNWLLS